MNQFTQLLRQSANEVRDYQHTSADAHLFDVSWLDSLARRLEFASTLEDEAALELEVTAIFHSVTDSGPTDCSPSLDKIADALQRRRKRLGRKL
jgi:hypothetical protein